MLSLKDCLCLLENIIDPFKGLEFEYFFEPDGNHPQHRI